MPYLNAAWLDENCGSAGWALTPSGARGVLNDAISIYFADATLAGAFVARWCLGSKAETTRRAKEQLQDEIAQHEQIAEEIERASEPSADDVDCGSEKL